MFISKKKYNDLLARIEKCERYMNHLRDFTIKDITNDERDLCARLTTLERYAKNKKAAEKTALESLPDIGVGRYGL